jgi:hypothetical protein
MAYCPQCGREQRCGCDICHACGVKLVSIKPGSAGNRGRGTPVPGAPEAGGAERERSERKYDFKSVEESREARPVVPTLLLALGCAALILALLGMMQSISDFPATGSTVSMMDSLKRMGYFVGHLLYSGSYRLLLGFTLVALGLLINPTGPFKERETWRLAVRAFSVLAFAGGVCCLLVFLVLIIPAGDPGVYVTGLLPELWAALPVLVVLGLSLSFTGGALVVQFFREPGE